MLSLLQYLPKVIPLGGGVTKLRFLDTMQGMSSYVTTMDDLSRMPGRMSGLYQQALEHGA
jgi:hypothetical protein